MRDSIALAKAQRLNHICHLLYRHPRGLTVAELGRLCGVAKRTTQRDLRSLEDMNIPLWDDAEERAAGNPPRYGIIEGYYLPPVHLSLGSPSTARQAPSTISSRPLCFILPVHESS